MTDAEFEEQKARIQCLIDRWIGPIGLGWWTIVFRFRREPGDQHGVTGTDMEFETAFTCASDWRYGIATITAYLPSIVDHSDDQLEGMFVHELMHVFLSEMRVSEEDEIGQQRAHEERVATTLAKGFMWMRDTLLCKDGHVGDGAVQEVVG